MTGRARVIDWVVDRLRKLVRRADTPTPSHLRRTPEDLFAFGGSREAGFPRPPRARQDFHLASDTGTIPGHAPPTSAADEIPGASTFRSVDEGLPFFQSGTTQVFGLPAGTDLPPGLAYHADGSDIPGGTAPAGHRTIYNTDDMSYSEFSSLYANPDVGWAHHGTVRRGQFSPTPPPT